jgi:hypothetical protein
MRFRTSRHGPTPRGLLVAFLKVTLLLAGIVAIYAQVSVTVTVFRQPGSPTWDAAQNWYQAERIRTGDRLYWPMPWYGPHVMATRMDGFVTFPIDRSPHLPFPAAIVALTPVRSIDTFAATWIVVLVLAVWSFSSVVAVLAHGRWTVSRFLWWNGLVFLVPYSHYAFQIGNIDPVLWLLFALAIALPARVGSGALVLSAAVKPFAAWPLAFFLIRTRETWLAAILAAVAVVTVCVAAIGPLELVRHARDWLAYVPAAMGQGTFHHQNFSLSFGVLRVAYALGWWDYQPGPIVDTWARMWLASAQLAAPVAAGLLTLRWDRRFHLSAVILAALLFNPLCWAYYLTVALVPFAVWWGRRDTAPRRGSTKQGEPGAPDARAPRTADLDSR